MVDNTKSDTTISPDDKAAVARVATVDESHILYFRNYLRNSNANKAPTLSRDEVLEVAMMGSQVSIERSSSAIWVRETIEHLALDMDKQSAPPREKHTTFYNH